MSEPEKSEAKPVETRQDHDGNSSGDIRDRLTKLETRFETELPHLATKAWVLGGVVVAIIASSSFIIALLRFWPQ